MKIKIDQIPKCEICGKEYIENKNIPEHIPPFLKEIMKYIPSCDCLKQKEERLRIQEEKNWEQERLRNKIKKFKDISVIDKKFLKSKFSGADMEEKHMALCKQYTDKFIKTGGAPVGLLLFGDVGTGKTFASACICNELMEHGHTVLVMNLGLYLLKLKKEWSEAESEILKYSRECDLLIIDDFGSENVTPFVREKVFTLIDARYRDEKPMIITTNLPLNRVKTDDPENEPPSIELEFGERIKDRLSEMCLQVSVTGKSRRKMDNSKLKQWLTA